jgi:nucleotide-binding universal stress UspA family protein
LQEAVSAFEAACEEADVSYHVLWESGDPLDLIVMGDGAHGTFARRVLGDTLLHVVRKADRPLFLTH